MQISECSDTHFTLRHRRVKRRSRLINFCSTTSDSFIKRGKNRMCRRNCLLSVDEFIMQVSELRNSIGTVLHYQDNTGHRIRHSCKRTDISGLELRVFTQYLFHNFPNNSSSKELLKISTSNE